MTIGIYALYWEDQDLIYVGKSSTLDRRRYEHFRLLKNGEHAQKLQSAFNKYGYPKFFILEICEYSSLDTCEVCWINEFNALDSLNTLPGGQTSGTDTTHSSSKFSKSQILELCEVLLDYRVSQREASKITGISEAVISTILNGSKHTWIPDNIRNSLNNIKELRYNYHKANSKHKNYCIESPQGVIYSNILNITEFAKRHNLLGTKLSEVLSGKRPQHLGWKLPVNQTIT